MPGQAAGGWHQEGDPCRRRQEGGSPGGRPLTPPPPPRPPSLTYLSGPTGIGSSGRAGPGLPPESTGPRAVGSGGSILAESLGPLPPSLLAYTHPTPPNRSSRRPTLGALLAASITEPLQPRLPWALTSRSGSVSRSLGPPNPWLILHNAPGVGRSFLPLGHAGSCSFGAPHSSAFWLT